MIGLEHRARALVELGESKRGEWNRLKEQVDAMVSSGASIRAIRFALAFDPLPSKHLGLATTWAREGATETCVLSGPVGTGKTVAAARYAVLTGAAWCSAPMLCLDQFAAAAERIAKLSAAKHLVLDEVGAAGTTSSYAAARVAAVLTARYASGRPTVVTTNLSTVAFARVYDGVEGKAAEARSRLLDRMREGGSWVVCAGKSLRVSGAKPPNRYDHAKSSLALVERAESGAASPGELDELQEALGLGHEVDERAAEIASRKGGMSAQLREKVAELVSKTASQSGSEVAQCP